MATTDVWMDYDSVRHAVKNNTVERLKQILSGLNEECGTHISKTGKKQDIIDRIHGLLDLWRAGNLEDKWMRAKAIIYQVRSSGSYTPTRMPSLSNSLPSNGSHVGYDPPKPNHYASSLAVPSSSSIGHYDPYAPPRRPTTMSTPIASTSTSSGSKSTGIRFKESPFFSIDQSVSVITECPESTSATDRRQQALLFSLTSEHLTKMKSGSNFQLRLFCTSSIFYAGTNSFRSNTLPCLIEFPPTCEVRVNTTQITANLKGLKKKPGTAPPPDITKLSRTTGQNRIEMVYVNSQQPVQSKKYYMVVMLVEAIPIETLVKNLQSMHHKSAAEIRQKMIQAMSEDDDIIAGPQKMSLKCPLTFVRISTPCRSSKCVHPQCFDATSWFTMMEQTTTWLCPVCEKTLDHRDLIMDGYFDEILKQTPESIEDVMVEADGQWHTSDNKYGSVEWKAAHPLNSKSSASSKRPSPPPANPVCPPINLNGYAQPNGVNGKGKAPDVEIFVLDSDDEDEGRVKRELSPSFASSTSYSFEGSLPRASQSQTHTLPPQTQTQTEDTASSNVIDLTLDSEDESDEDVPIVSRAQESRAQEKRKASLTDLSTPADQMWKKTRVDTSSRILPAPRSSAGLPSITAPVSHTTSLVTLPPPSPGYHPSAFSNNVLPPPPTYTQYNPRLTVNPSTSSLQLPPLTNPTYRQAPTQSRWRQT